MKDLRSKLFFQLQSNCGSIKIKFVVALFITIWLIYTNIYNFKIWTFKITEEDFQKFDYIFVSS